MKRSDRKSATAHRNLSLKRMKREQLLLARDKHEAEVDEPFKQANDEVWVDQWDCETRPKFEAAKHYSVLVHFADEESHDGWDIKMQMKTRSVKPYHDAMLNLWREGMLERTGEVGINRAYKYRITQRGRWWWREYNT